MPKFSRYSKKSFKLYIKERLKLKLIDSGIHAQLDSQYLSCYDGHLGSDRSFVP